MSSSTEEYMSDTVSDEDTVILCSICYKEEDSIDVCSHCSLAICTHCQVMCNYHYDYCGECGDLTHVRDALYEEERCKEASRCSCYRL